MSDGAAPPSPVGDITQYLGLVRAVAGGFARRLPPSVAREDLISAGTVGLLDAATRFDPAHGEPFGAFAEWRIRGAIRDELRMRDTLSRDMRRLSNTIEHAATALEAQLHRAPTEDEIAREMGITVAQLQARRLKLTGSMVVSVEDVPALLDHVADPTAIDAFEQAARAEERRLLVARIETMPKQMRTVVSLLYFEHLTLHEIGDVLGVSESRACQIHGQAVRWLRTRLAEDERRAA